MDANQESYGEIAAGIGGLVLLLAMFLPWFGGDAVVEVPNGGSITAEGETLNAWESFAFIDLLLFLAGAVAMAIGALRLTGSTFSSATVPPGRILLVVGTAAAVLVFFRVLFPPDIAGDLVGSVEADTGRRIGLLVGLFAATGIAYGGYISLQHSQPPRRRS